MALEKGMNSISLRTNLFTCTSRTSSKGLAVGLKKIKVTYQYGVMKCVCLIRIVFSSKLIWFDPNKIYFMEKETKTFSKSGFLKLCRADILRKK